MKFQVNSEIGKLRAVIMQTPGPGVLRCDPLTVNSFSWDAVPSYRKATAEHEAFIKKVQQQGTEVYSFETLLAQTLENPKAKEELIAGLLSFEAPYLQTTTLECVRTYLESLNPTDFTQQIYHGLRKEELAEHAHGISLVDWVSNNPWVLYPMTNILFTRDPAMILGDHPLFGCMYNRDREKEPICYKTIFKYHPLFQFWDKKAWYGLDPEDTYPIEGGNCHRYAKDLVLIGVNDRTSPQAIERVSRRLMADGQTEQVLVLAFDNPRLNAADPMGMYLHVDMFLNHIDRDAFLFYPVIEPLITPLLISRGAKEELKIERQESLFGAIKKALRLDSLRIVEVGGGKDSPYAFTEQRAGSGGNTVNLAPGVVCIWDRNEATIEALDKAGITVIPIEADELVKGGGGPRCSTMPLWRDDLVS